MGYLSAVFHSMRIRLEDQKVSTRNLTLVSFSGTLGTTVQDADGSR